jgi:hypothetical protein
MIYTGSGSIRVSGCAIKKVKKNFSILYALGSRVYIKQKAKEGILESVVLKKVHRNTQERYTYSGYMPVVAYVDTFNRVWIEDELISQQRAIDFAKLHWERIQKDAADYLENGQGCIGESC